MIKMWILIVLICPLQAGNGQTCGDGYYNYNPVTCWPCYKGCKTCSNWTSCDVCKPGYYGGTGCRCSSGCTGGTCLDTDGNCTCISGYYKDVLYTSFYNQSTYECIRCRINCSACTVSSQCDTCLLGFYGQSCQLPCQEGCKNGECQKSDGWCKCADGYFSNNNGSTCSLCPDNCATCSNTSLLTCDTCRTGFYGNLCKSPCSEGCVNVQCQKSNGWCTCGDGYFRNDTGFCVRCPDSCTICNSSYCDACKKGFYYQQCELPCSEHCANGECRKSDGNCACADGYYYDNTESKCVRCPGNCTTCGSSSSCIDCTLGFYGALCQYSCHQHCSMCTNSTNCLRCQVGYFGQLCEECPPLCLNGCVQLDGACDNCVGGYYKKDRQCNSCSSSCIECLNGDTCKTCNDGYYLAQGSSHCEACQEECLICNDKTTCTKCKEGYANVNGTCTSCKSCKNATSCSSTNVCSECLNGFWGSHCLQNCSMTCVHCDKVTGECTGCKNDTFGRFCEDECSNNCLKISYKYSSCLQHNGTCVGGCKAQFIGPNCKEAPVAAATSASIMTYITVGIVCGAVALILIIAGILMWNKRLNISNVKTRLGQTASIPYRPHGNLNPTYDDRSDVETNAGEMHDTAETSVAGNSDIGTAYTAVRKESSDNHDQSSTESGTEETVYNVAQYKQAAGIQTHKQAGSDGLDTYCHIAHASSSKDQSHMTGIEYGKT